MTENVKIALAALRAQEYKKERIEIEDYNLTEQVKHLEDRMRRPAMLRDMFSREVPHFLEGDIFGFNRTVPKTPYYLDRNGRRHQNTGGNITMNYGRVITEGFDASLELMDPRVWARWDGRIALFP